ncbi:MAG: phage tail tape measure protein [Blautia sp.]|nr:phage tail tape measure protein [Blautia sp.]
MAESFSVKAILSAKDSNFSSTMKACSGYAENLKSTLTSGIGFGAMAAIGSKAVSVVGNGLKSLTTGAISAGTNFESAMSSVASISGSTGNDLKELTSKAKQMGATTQFSATEAANAMEYMAMAGWKTKDMVSGIGGIMNLAAASGSDLARTSDIVTDALTAFGKSASDSGTFADVMAAASSNANTNVEMMGETFKYVGAAAGAMGYSIQDIALATGLMANSGIKGSEAGTALRSVITRMAKPTKESSAAMKKLGLSITDSKGRMKSFGTIMKDMRKGMKGMTEDQKASYAAMLGGQEAMSGVLAIANASEKDFNKLSKAIDNSKNAAQNMAKVKLDNLKGDVTILKSSMEGIGITIFDQVGGNLRGLVGTATDVVGKINEKLSNGKGIENFIYKMQLLQRKATPYWNILKIDAIEAGKALGDAIGAIITDISKLTGSFGSTDSIRNFSDVIGTAKDGIVTFSGFLEEHSDTVAKVIVLLPKLLLAYKGFKIVGAVAPFIGVFASGIARLGKAGLSKIAPNLFKVAKGQEAAGKASSGSAKKMVASAKAFALMGVGVLTIGAGFYLLAQSAVAVANAGPGAVAVLAVLVGVVTGLTVGMTKMLSTMSGGTKKLSAMTPALLALGASILLASAGMAVLAYSAVQITQAGPGAAAVLLGMVVALGALLLVAKSVAPAMTAGAAGFVAFGAAVLLAGAGIAVLSLAAISLANAGPVAIGVMVGMVAAVALLAAGAAVLGPALTVGAVGFIAFGAAIVLVATGALIASAALAIVAAVLPTVSQYGTQGAVAIAQLGAGFLAFGAGAAVAGAGAVVLGAGLTIVAAGLALVGAAVLVAAAGVLVLAAGAAVLGASLVVAGAGLTLMGAAFPLVAAGAMSSATGLAALLGAGTAASAVFVVLAGSSGAAAVTVGVFAASMITGAAGTAVMVVALKAVNSSMKSIAENAKSAEKSLTSMRSSVNVVNSGLDALGNKAKSAINALISQFSRGESKAKTSGIAVGNNYNSGVMAGMTAAVNTANVMSNMAVVAMRSAAGGAYSSGVYIGAGLARGLNSQVGPVRAAAAQLAAAAEAAIRAKAKIHSPSKVSDKLGGYYGIGFGNGILDKVKYVKKAVMHLIDIPTMVAAPEIGVNLRNGSEDLEETYNYTRNARYTLYVPVEVDGRQIAKATATYTKEEIEKQQKRDLRKKGKR